MGSSINEYINLILVFMGDASRLRNPHLRATLAEALEAILPHKQQGSGRTLNRYIPTIRLFILIFVLVHLLKLFLRIIH